MTLSAPLAPTQSTGGFRPKRRLGFNSRIAFTGAGGAAQGLRDGIALFAAAEALGYQSGWAYQRHFDNYLSAPLPFFAAAGQHTRRIALGSAVIPMRYQEPILLAEAAATTDLLIGGRLHLAISAGDNALFDAVFGTVAQDARTEAQHRQRRFLEAISGAVLHRVSEPDAAAAPGTELRATPHSPGLRGRIRQGVSSIGSAVHAARLGLGLMTGTVQHGHDPDEPFPAYQARIIAAYRAEWARLWDGPPPPVAVAASILPATTPELAALYAAYDHERRTQGIAASRPAGALAPSARTNAPPGSQISPVFHGSPDRVTQALLDDPGIAGADELVLFLPPAFDADANRRLLTDLARTVAPELGWSPDAPLPETDPT